MFAAVTGDEDVCRERAEAARTYALARGLGLAAALALWALAFLDLSTGRYAASAARLRALAGFGPGHGHRAIRHLATPHYVEAAVRTGDTRVARAAHADYDRWARTVRSPDDLALSARCRALLASGARGRRALPDRPRPACRRYPRLRTRPYGAAVRRRATTAAATGRRRVTGCTARSKRSSTSVRRTVPRRPGGNSAPWVNPPNRRAGPDDLAARLTAQQLTVARMAADGATNREIASRLVLSPRTIDHHLRGVFNAASVFGRGSSW